ncbi:sigma-70 family RNA polymerase sigma factor [Leucobacter coleopterorum]|uniref:Sigma-70 family RNA polymerase sigma factor n=1 Tax=Leucobacter coleopterorum TaxID=2714933 RepID=A0ABX6K1Q0_9MICO|nr:sigma-70 family RNA polymerase sigma factor [Leucobacter coleopterorum]QIM19114.1 sigma-70 family RNA polymerase sigma factor [Leucobacter coleopterorum]
MKERQAAFAELYSRYRGVAFARALHLVRSSHHAEDIVAEVFAKIFAALQKGLGPRTSFIAYLFTALRGELGRATKTERNTSALADDELEKLPAVAIEDVSVQHMENDLLARALGSLSESWQRVLWLTEVEGLSHDQAGELLELSGNAVAALAFRAREGLRVAYLQQYIEQSAPGCRGVAAFLAGYVRGSLPARKRKVASEHLQYCKVCAVQVAKLKVLNQSLRIVFGPLLVGGGAGVAVALTPGSGAAAASEGVVRNIALLVKGKANLRAIGVLFALAAGVAGVFLFVQPGQQAESSAPTTPVNKVAELDTEEPHSTSADAEESAAVDRGEPGVETAPRGESVETSRESDPAPERPGGDDASPNWVLIH